MERWLHQQISEYGNTAGASLVAGILCGGGPQQGVHLGQQCWGALQIVHRFIGMQGAHLMVTFLQRQDLDSWPCSTRHLDSGLTLLVRHGMTYHNNPYRPFPQALPQPGKPAAYLHREVTLQNALPGVEQHIVMSVTNQTRSTRFHNLLDYFLQKIK